MGQSHSGSIGPAIHRHSSLLLLSLLNASAVADRMVIGALAPVIQPALGLSDAGLGIAQGPAFGFAFGLTLPVAGRLVDAAGGRRVLTGSVLLWTLGMIVSAAAGSLAILVAGRAITGIGQAALLPAALSLILRPGATRTGRMVGLFVGAGTLGRSIAFALGGALLWSFDAIGAPIAPWSAVLLTLAAGNLLLLVPIARERDRGGREGGSGEPAADPPPAAYAALRQRWRAAPRAIGAVVVAAIGTVIVAQALAAWIAVAMVRGFAIPPAQAATTIGLVGIAAGPLGALAGGILADRSSRIARDQAIVTVLCAPAVIVFAHAATPVAAYAALAVLLFLSGAAASAGLVRFQRLIPAEARGSANGLFMALTSLVGVAGAPVLVAIVPLAAVGDRLATVVSAAAVVSALASLLARDAAARRPDRPVDT